MGIENRKFKRHTIYREGMIYSTSGARICPCVMRNVSFGGAQLELKRETELPTEFVLALSEKGEVRRWCKIMWQFSTVLGVKFVTT
jgi:hypothetical protein